MNIETLIVVVTYNSRDYIENCINSIIASDYKKWFLAIIDNNSADDTLLRIEGLKAKIVLNNSAPAVIKDGINFKIIRMKKNIGFAAAVNYAVSDIMFKQKTPALKNAENLVLLNPDLCIEKNTLSELLSTFTAVKSAGAVGGVIYDYNGSNIQHAGGIIKDNFITAHLTSPRQADSTVYRTDYVTGALFATKIDFFKNLGGFDSGYRPAYFEELDYCKKLASVGLSAVVNIKAVARHFEGASTGKFSPFFYRYYHKNRIRCAIINSGLSGFFKSFIPAEVKWLRNEATQDQLKPLAMAYFLNFVFLLYNLIVKIKNFFIISRYLKNIY